MYYEYQWQELLYMGFVFGLGFLLAVLAVVVVLGIIALIINFSEEIGLLFWILVILAALVAAGIGLYENIIEWLNAKG